MRQTTPSVSMPSRYLCACAGVRHTVLYDFADVPLLLSLSLFRCPMLGTATDDKTSTSNTSSLVAPSHPRHTLHGLEEVDERDIESATTPVRSNDIDPITEFTTLQDDDDNVLDMPGVVATQIVLSPSRAHALEQSRKRERALTMSSTSSKDGKHATQEPSIPASSKSSSEQRSHPISLPRRSSSHPPRPSQNAPRNERSHPIHRIHLLLRLPPLHQIPPHFTCGALSLGQLPRLPRPPT